MTARASIYDIRRTYTSTCMYLYVSLSPDRDLGREWRRVPQNSTRHDRQQIGVLFWVAYLDRHPWGRATQAWVNLTVSRAHSLTGISFLFGRRDSHHTLAFSSLSPTEAQAEASCGRMRSRSRIPTSKRTRGKESARSRTVARDRSKGGWESQSPGRVTVGSLVYNCVGQRGKESRAAHRLCIAGALVRLQVLGCPACLGWSGALSGISGESARLESVWGSHQFFFLWTCHGPAFACFSLFFPLLRIGLALCGGGESPCPLPCSTPSLQRALFLGYSSLTSHTLGQPLCCRCPVDPFLRTQGGQAGSLYVPPSPFSPH